MIGVSCRRVRLVPVVALAERAGLRGLVDEHLRVPSDKGAHGGARIAALVAGMVAGADSIEDMDLLRQPSHHPTVDLIVAEGLMKHRG
jgi:hypothetical protein